MLYRTLSEAQADYRQYVASWVTRVYVTVTLSDGQTYVRTYDFDQTRHKCRRCRRAHRRPHAHRRRLASTGHVCEICGNPYGGFVRQGVRKVLGRFEELNHCWSSSGRLH